jgi:hypothetical protein
MKTSLPINRGACLLIIAALMLITAHRLPAPIQEVPESPTPSATLAPTAKPKPNAKASESKTKSEAKPSAIESPSANFKAKSSLTSDDHNLHPYAGTWRGAITCGVYQDVEHVIVIDNNEKTMTVSKVGTGPGGVNASAAASVGADGLTVKFPWPNGTWALRLNPDGKTARVRLTSFMMDNSAIFHREP